MIIAKLFNIQKLTLYIHTVPKHPNTVYPSTFSEAQNCPVRPDLFSGTRVSVLKSPLSKPLRAPHNIKNIGTLLACSP